MAQNDIGITGHIGGVEITQNNVEQVLSEVEGKTELVMAMIGIKAEKYAKGRCPVDTGRLRNSITFQSDAKSMTIGTNVEYAPYVELGTSRNKNARPYIVPSVKDHIQEYRRMIDAELRK